MVRAAALLALLVCACGSRSGLLSVDDAPSSGGSGGAGGGTGGGSGFAGGGPSGNQLLLSWSSFDPEVKEERVRVARFRCLWEAR